MTNPLYDRIVAAWPHLATLADRARRGDPQARNALAVSVLFGAQKAPLTASDTLAIAKWAPK